MVLRDDEQNRTAEQKLNAFSLKTKRWGIDVKLEPSAAILIDARAVVANLRDYPWARPCSTVPSESERYSQAIVFNAAFAYMRLFSMLSEEYAETCCFELGALGGFEYTPLHTSYRVLRYCTCVLKDISHETLIWSDDEIIEISSRYREHCLLPNIDKLDAVTRACQNLQLNLYHNWGVGFEDILARVS